MTALMALVHTRYLTIWILNLISVLSSLVLSCASLVTLSPTVSNKTELTLKQSNGQPELRLVFESCAVSLCYVGPHFKLPLNV